MISLWIDVKKLKRDGFRKHIHWTEKRMHAFVLLLYFFFKDVLICLVFYFYSLNIWEHSIFIQASLHRVYLTCLRSWESQRLHGMWTEKMSPSSLCLHTTISSTCQHLYLTLMELQYQTKKDDLYRNKYLIKLSLLFLKYLECISKWRTYFLSHPHVFTYLNTFINCWVLCLTFQH